MPHAVADDDVKLYYEDTGSGPAIVFVHEFAGDSRSWEHQVRHFTRWYRCVTFNARGYPPSGVPTDDASYSQDHAREDIRAVMDHLGIEQAHVVGHSMGAFSTLHFALEHAGRARSVVLAGCGYGANPETRDEFMELCAGTAEMFRAEGAREAGEKYALSPGRTVFKAKDPRGWRAFTDELTEHSAEGSALTMLNVQMKRPSLWDMTERLQRMTVPALVIAGDEDAPCLEPGVFLKRHIPAAGLAMVPMAGHTLPLEEPGAFNLAVRDFLASVELGRWAWNRG